MHIYLLFVSHTRHSYPLLGYNWSAPRKKAMYTRLCRVALTGHAVRPINHWVSHQSHSPCRVPLTPSTPLLCIRHLMSCLASAMLLEARRQAWCLPACLPATSQSNGTLSASVLLKLFTFAFSGDHISPSPQIVRLVFPCPPTQSAHSPIIIGSPNDFALFSA